MLTLAIWSNYKEFISKRQISDLQGEGGWQQRAVVAMGAYNATTVEIRFPSKGLL